MEDPITRPVLAAGFFVGDTPHLAVGTQQLFNRLQEPSQPRLATFVPKLAPIFQMLTLLKLLMPEVASHNLGQC